MFKYLTKADKNEVASLFSSVFTASEGEKEGALIGDLALKLSLAIDNQEIISLGAYDQEAIIGVIFFTRLSFEEKISVYMLAPVAVSTLHQRQGVGKELIHYGLNELKNRLVEVVVTYGDPLYYSATGFKPLSVNIVQAPHALSMPQGWQGQSLSQTLIPAIQGRPTCVKEFDDLAYW